MRWGTCPESVGFRYACGRRHIAGRRRSVRNNSPASMIGIRPIVAAAEPLKLSNIATPCKRDVAGTWACGATRTAWRRRNRASPHWSRYVLPRQFADPTGWELQNMLCVARLIIEAAVASGCARVARSSRLPTNG